MPSKKHLTEKPSGKVQRSGFGDPKRKINTATSCQENSSTVLLGAQSGNEAIQSYTDLKHAIERGNVAAKASALECLIRQHMNGESQNHMIVQVIKFLTPVDDHYVKKLVLYFWEVVDKTDENGNLLSEVILICSFLRSDLKHPNEYVRGLTLRFLCKVHEKELLEPLVSVVVTNLSDSVSYVRRSAALAIHSIYENFPDLLPDAVELVEGAIYAEKDLLTQRNLFDMLAHFSPERAAAYLNEFIEAHESSLGNVGSAFLHSVVSFCRQQLRTSTTERMRYAAILFAVLQSRDASVMYACASTLLTLTHSPAAITQAIRTYVDVLQSQSDNTVRLIVVEQLHLIKEQHRAVLEASLPDILSVLHQEVVTELRQALWGLASDLVSKKTVDEFVGMILKELMVATQEIQTASATDSNEGASGMQALERYRLDLIRSLRVAVDKFSDLVGDRIALALPDCYCFTVVGKERWMNVGVSNGNRRSRPGEARQEATSSDVACSNVELLVLMKHTLHHCRSVRDKALVRLCQALSRFVEADVQHGALWLLGAYCDPDGALGMIQKLRAELGAFPLVLPKGPSETETSAAAAGELRPVTTVQEDGTYGVAYVTGGEADAVPSERWVDRMGSSLGESFTGKGDTDSPLRVQICRGDDFLLSSFITCLQRLLRKVPQAHRAEAKNIVQEIVVECLRYAETLQSGSGIEIGDDALEQLQLTMAMLSEDEASASKEILANALQTSVELLKVYAPEGAGEEGSATGGKGVGAAAESEAAAALLRFVRGQGPIPENGIQFSEGDIGAPLQFSLLGDEETADVPLLADGLSLEVPEKKISGSPVSCTSLGNPAVECARLYLQRLEEVQVVSGTCDPIYCEVRVVVNGFDVNVEWRLANNTSSLLKNVMVDLASLGGMKLCERAQLFSLQPHETLHMRTPLKVGSTETGVIFGYLLFEYPDGKPEYMVLENITVDVMQYILPVHDMSDATFRVKWKKSDWENKIVISTSAPSLDAYVTQVEEALNVGRVQSVGENERVMAIVSGENSARLRGGQTEALAGCLCYNLAARSVFGEDLLVNISVETSGETDGISGIIRIRSKTHTLAYGVGKKLNTVPAAVVEDVIGDSCG